MDDQSPARGPADARTAVITAGPTPPTTPTESPAAPGTGNTVIDHFELLETVGRGGCGVVYRAFDRKLRREVAVKLMATDLAASSPARKRFVREARAAAAVRHENVVRIHAVEERGTPYLVMEYVPGTSLCRYLAEHGPLAARDVLRIGAQVARGLAAAHERGLVHRDVKPGNILIEWAGDAPRVKLTDFGIARAADDASLTQSGTVLGTPLYMTPEQARGEALDHRSDLYSLGSVLYEMTTGRPPFRAANSLAVLKRVTDDHPRPVRDVAPDAPDWLCAVIARLQAKRPAARFQTAAALADLLEHRLAKPDRGGVAAGAGRRRRTRWLVATAALVAGVGLAAGGRLFPLGGRGPGSDESVVALAAGAGEAAGRDVSGAGPDAGPAPPPTAAEITAELRERNPAFKGEVETKVEDGRCVELYVRDATGVTDVSPVRRLRHLRAFRADNTRVADLGPLRGMPLKSLWLSSNSVLRDLDPLRGMPLETLAIWGFQGDDLSPLAGMPLKFLNCGGGYRKLDLTPLRGAPLTSLNLNCTEVDDLSPLKGMPLEDLMLNPSRVTDLSPLVGMPLKRLFVNNAPVADFAPIRGLPLEVLVMDFVPARDTTLLRAMPTLKVINKKPAEAFWAEAARP